MTLSSPVGILKKIVAKESYIKLNALLVNKAFCTKEKLLFPYHKFSNSAILLTDKDPWRNHKTKENFNRTDITLDFKRFDTSTNFKGYDVVIPITIDDLMVCSSHRESIKQDIIPIPSVEAINICHNKNLLNATLQSAGLGNFTPGNNIQFPYIVKGKTGEYSKEAFIINNADDEILYAKLLNDPNFFKQELIAGDTEYATHIVFKNGKIAASVTVCYKYSQSVYLQGKTKQICSYVVKSKHLDAFAQILNTIGYEGLCCIDYKIHNGVPKIFEINPRFGGSLSLYFFSLLRHLN